MKNYPSQFSLSSKNSWAVKQQGNPLRVWHSLDGKKIQLSLQEEAASIWDKATEMGAETVEIPSHWQALPTGMDLQVHLRFPGQPQKELLEGGLASALDGGFDTILTMPNTAPFLDQPEILNKAVLAAQELTKDYPVQVLFTASATKGMQGQEPTDISALVKAGAAAITDDGWGVKSEQAQEEIFHLCEKADVIFQQHAEMPGHKGVATRSHFQQSASLPEYPRTAESEMIRRDIALLRKHPKARYHVLHISTRESLEEIRKAKAEGLRVTAEVTPHHLIFSNEDIPSTSDPRCTFFKMNPPLFSPKDRAALRAALRDGTIDCVSTDHAPHELENKAQTWNLAPFGTRGLVTALPALLQLVHEKELSMERLVEVFSTNPRKILNKQSVQIPTGILFVDPTKEWIVEEKDLPGISRNNCFLGKELHGRLELRCHPTKIYQRTPNKS